MVNRWANNRGWLMTEAMVAMGILVSALLPLAGSFVYEQHVCRLYYQRAVAMEIVDGEMEILVAGEWRSFGEGIHPYPVFTSAARNLPPGNFVLTVRNHHVRLEWQPATPRLGSRILREADVP